jgi:hypothetical protein
MRGERHMSRSLLMAGPMNRTDLWTSVAEGGDA